MSRAVCAIGHLHAADLQCTHGDKGPKTMPKKAECGAWLQASSEERSALAHMGHPWPWPPYLPRLRRLARLPISQHNSSLMVEAQRDPEP